MSWPEAIFGSIACLCVVSLIVKVIDTLNARNQKPSPLIEQIFGKPKP